MLGLAALALSLPLHFEPVPSQGSPETTFGAVTTRYAAFLSDTAVTLKFPNGAQLSMRLPRATPHPRDPLPGRSNYYVGPDNAAWRTNIPQYGRVEYPHVFPGIDLAVYGSAGQIEYDWRIAPHADPVAIRLFFTGASNVRISREGDLVLSGPAGEIRHRKPAAYQIRNGVRREITASYRIGPRGAVSFRLGPYRRDLPLVIDPVIVFAAGFGGYGFTDIVPPFFEHHDAGRALRWMVAETSYIGGTSYSTSFPLTQNLSVPGCPQPCSNGASFVAKLSPDGQTLLYATYLVGPNPAVYPPPGFAITADRQGNVYATGGASARSFRVVGGGGAVSKGIYNAFLIKLDTPGALVASALFGGSVFDAGSAITFGPDSALYVAGTTASPDFPTTAGAYRTSAPGGIFLMKLKPELIAGNLSCERHRVFHLLGSRNFAICRRRRRG